MEYMTHPDLIDYESGAAYERRTSGSCTGIGDCPGPEGKFHLYADEGKSNFLYFSNPSIDVALKIGGCILRASRLPGGGA